MGNLEGNRRLRTEFRSLTQPYPVEVTYLPDNPDLSRISAELSDNIPGIFRQSLMDYVFAAFFMLLGFYLLRVLMCEEHIHLKQHNRL